MRLPIVAIVLAACSTAGDVPPPKRPNNELIVGDFERRPPDGQMAVRFLGDGTFWFAKTRAELERTPRLGEGTYKLDADQLAFTSTKGQCDAGSTGAYKVVISKIGIRFVKVDDGCADRSRIDGQTWWRIK
jgi:hypothetical protein